MSSVPVSSVPVSSPSVPVEAKPRILKKMAISRNTVNVKREKWDERTGFSKSKLGCAVDKVHKVWTHGTAIRTSPVAIAIENF